MRIVLFCEQKYAINILTPIQEEALKSGADIIKLFPGSVYGPSVISAFKAPLPQLNIMPTGGVSLENMAEWFDAGVTAVGVGGNLLAPAATGDFEKVREVAQAIVDKDPNASLPENEILWRQLKALRKTNVNWAAIS